MKIVKCWKKFRRHRRTWNKIDKALPKYHPVTGQPLDWAIYITFPKISYDPRTGKKITFGLPKLSIYQKAPVVLVDDRVYKFNWKKKKIEIETHGRWM